MSSLTAPNVGGAEVPGRRTVHSMCGMRCPIEVTVEDRRMTWLQDNPHDKAIGTSLCAKGAAAWPLEFDAQRPQTPRIRTGPRGGGQWRRESWDQAPCYLTGGLTEMVEAVGARGIALADLGGPIVDLTRTFVRALSSPKTPAHHGFVRDRPPDHKTAHLDRDLCPSCTRQRADRPPISAIAAAVKPPHGRRSSTAGAPARLRRPGSQQGHGGKS